MIALGLTAAQGRHRDKIQSLLTFRNIFLKFDFINISDCDRATVVVFDSGDRGMLLVQKLPSDCWVHPVYEETVAFPGFGLKRDLHDVV